MKNVLIVLSVLVISCQYFVGPQGPEGPQGEQGEQGIPGRDGRDATEDLIVQTTTGYFSDLSWQKLNDSTYVAGIFQDSGYDGKLGSGFLYVTKSGVGVETYTIDYATKTMEYPVVRYNYMKSGCGVFLFMDAIYRDVFVSIYPKYQFISFTER